MEPCEERGEKLRLWLQLGYLIYKQKKQRWAKTEIEQRGKTPKFSPQKRRISPSSQPDRHRQSLCTF